MAQEAVSRRCPKGSAVIWIVGGLLIAAAALTACSGRQAVAIDDVVLSGDAQTISFTTGTCDRNEAASVEETARTVTIHATADRAFDGGEDCDAILSVTLREPLGQRLVVDAASGERVVPEATDEPPGP